MASKRKYWEGWGFTDLIKVILTGKPKERNEAYNEVSKTFEEAQVEKIGTDQIEVYLPEHEIKNLKAMAKLFGLKVQYSTGGALTTESYKTGGRPSMSIAEVILQQIGGMNRVVAMTGAYNFVAGSNYLAFKIKNRRANYIKITLNGKDLYDIEIGRIFGSKYNVVKTYKDVYFDQLIPLLEEGTGMYFRFAKGGAVKKKEVTEAAMLAPNGKPSNLTPEQYKLVRTQAFKNWFGDWEKLAMTKLYDAGIDEISMKRLSEGVSKVVDENGEPLVVYHGTKKDFTVFGTENKLSAYLPEYRHLYSWKMKTHYFHKDKQYSETFGSKYGGKDLAFFLKADNLVLAESEDDMEDIGYWEGIYKYYVEELNADAIYDSKGQYATLLNSNQIKLADGSNTTFDSNNPDIRFDNGGQVDYLLAPNGKPSNLTPEQYRLVRTKAFKDWFGDWENSPETSSKVVDENGEPLAVFHGSQSEFNVFDKTKSGESNIMASVGHWFTPIEEFAKSFAENIWYGDRKLTIYSVFLSLKNPKVYVSDGDNTDKIKILSDRLVPLKNEVDYLIIKWRDDYQDYQVFSYATQGVINSSNINNYLRTNNSVEVIKDGIKYNEIQLEISKIRNEINDLRYADSYEKFRTDVHKIEGGNSETANTGGLGMSLKNYRKTVEEYKQSLIEQGFDGIIIEKTRFDSSVAGGLNDQFVAFESNQIKLADGSNTTFDGNNPDIRFEEGGYLEQIANDPALEYAKGGLLHKNRKKRIKDDKMVFDIPEQPDQVFDSEIFGKGGKLGAYSFVTAYTETGKKLHKIWKGKPTHQTVFNFFNKLNNSAGQKINIVDAEIETKSFSTFNRETFLTAANKVAMEQYGSGIDDVDELIFTFDKEKLNVFPFEAELENDKDVEISCIDGVIFITEIED